MKYIICFILILIFFSTFFYGVAVGHFEFFPFTELKYLKTLFFNDYQNQQISYLDLNVDVNSLIDINTIDDISNKRKKLLNFLWNDNLPNLNNLIVENNIIDLRYTNIPNLQFINKYEISMDNQINSIVYHFVPDEPNSDLIIYHQGHSGDFFMGYETIQFFLSHGYSVLAFSMPLLGMNDKPEIHSDDFGMLKLISHDQLIFLETEKSSPLKYFIEPIWLSLDYIQQNFSYTSFYMIGISGGGWTAMLYPAIDDRISESYSVAGSLPLFLRSESKNIGDYEQTQRDIYIIANYLELYLMASFGDDRKFIQIFNENDPCCFSGDPRGFYDKDIQNRLTQLGNGTFKIFIDSTHNEHNISNFSRDLILGQITT